MTENGRHAPLTSTNGRGEADGVSQAVNNVTDLRLKGMEAFDKSDFDVARSYFTQCLTLKPDDQLSHRLLGTTYARIGRTREALQTLQTAIRIKPSDAVSWYETANLLTDINQCNAALKAYSQALRFKPDYVQAAHNRADLLVTMGKVGEAVDEYRRILRDYPDCSVTRDNLLLALNYLPEEKPENVFAEHVRLCNRYAPTRSIPLSVSPPPPLRIGLVSADFRRHSVAYFIRPLLGDTEETEVYCYASVSQPDRMTETLKDEASHWRDISKCDDSEAAHLIARDGIHVLVDLSGHTAGNRLGIFAYRPAPISATYLGYPNTTALPQINYRITAKTAEPPDTGNYYTEKPVFLPYGFLCYCPPDTTPDPQENDRSRPVTYASFNNIAKISDQTIEAWCEILKRSVGSRLLLKYGRLGDWTVAEELADRFSRFGIERDRLEFLGETENPWKHLEYYREVDIALDIIGYGGTTTTCEALWMGVPVVTYAGDRHCQLVGSSILGQLGIPEWIASNMKEYIETAILLGERPPRLRGTSLRSLMRSSPLCDRDAFSQAFRNLMYRLWNEGKHVNR